MLAVRTTDPGGYVPTLAVDVEVRMGGDSADLDEIADGFVLSLREQFDSAELIKRRTSATDNSTAILQLIEIEEQREGHRFDLQQVQVVQAVRDSTDSRKQIVLSCTMISEFKDSDLLRDEFADFMESVAIIPAD